MFAATSMGVGVGGGILNSNPPPLPLHLHLHHLHSSSPSPVFLPITKTHFSLSSSSSSISNSNYSYSNQEEEVEEDEDEQVIGDCLVFEDGIFEDPFLQQHSNPNPNPNPNPSPEPDNTNNSNSLVPEEWAEAVEEINLTKQQRRKIAQETQFGQRIFKKKAANSVNLEEFMRFQDYKLSQLKPLVLDNPPKQDYSNVTHGSSSLSSSSSSSSSRVEPKNPRWAVYGRSLDDISEFFNSPKYQPADNEEGAASQSKSQGRQKLFTKEEKVLMNARKPTLALATSIKWLPLHTLAASGEFYLLNNLMKSEVDINAVDQDGLTALHKAIICKKQAITNYLLRESADSSIRDKDGATLMHYAVQAASTEAIKTLLLYNVDINTQDNEGWSPLHLAVQGRRTDIVRLLLMKGADKTLKNQDGATPLELCLYSGRDSRTYQLIKLLKELPRSRQHR